MVLKQGNYVNTDEEMHYMIYITFNNEQLRKLCPSVFINIISVTNKALSQTRRLDELKCT